MSDVPIAEPELGAPEKEGVADVIESGTLTDGEVVRTFEREFARHCGVDRGVATCNGTAALHAALEAVGIEPGRGVVTTPFTFVATANAIRMAGGLPLFVDIDPETYNLDPHRVEERLRESPEDVDAIVAVHLFGLPADVAHLRDLADTYDVALIEDAAQAHGARYRDDPVGSLGDLACFSFYPTKNMTTGEGGMVTTDRDDLADAVRRFVDHGRGEGRYEHDRLGHNFRMTDVAAAIGRAQLSKLPDFVAARRENARRLTERLERADVETPVEPADRIHAYNQYTIRTDDREARRRALEERGIDTAVYYPTCVGNLDAYDWSTRSTPRAEAATEEVLSLPVHPGVDDGDVDEMADALTEVGTIRD